MGKHTGDVCYVYVSVMGEVCVLKSDLLASTYGTS